MEAIEVARRAVEAASEKKASNIVLLDLSLVNGFTDYFVICSADTARQIGAIDEEIERVLRQEGISLYHSEGTIDSGWLLLDYGSVIVHIFAEPEREYYDLDSLWSQANALVRIQ